MTAFGRPVVPEEKLRKLHTSLLVCPCVMRCVGMIENDGADSASEMSDEMVG